MLRTEISQVSTMYNIRLIWDARVISRKKAWVWINEYNEEKLDTYFSH